MNKISYIIIAVAVLFGMYALMHAPLYGDTNCMPGFQHSHFGQCVDGRFFEIPNVYAESNTGNLEITDEDIEYIPKGCEPDMYGNFYCYEEEDSQKINLQNAIKYFGNTERVGEQYFGGGAIDMDPDLSPSYAYDFALGTFYYTLIPLATLALAISGIFLVPYFILKSKKIAPRPYLSLILAGVLLFLFLPNLAFTIPTFIILISQSHLMEDVVIQALVFATLPSFIGITVAGILLYRSSVIRNLIKR